MFRGKMEMVATFTFKGKASGGNAVYIYIYFKKQKIRYNNLGNRRKIPNSRERVRLILIRPINLSG